MRNEDVVKLLEDIAAALELKGESPFKIRAYQNAARNVGFLSEDVETLAREGRLDEIAGVGPSIAEKITQYLKQGRSAYLEQVIGEIPAGVFDLLKVPGIGPRKARALFSQLSVTSLAELAEAARSHRIREVEGFGEKSEANLLKELDRVQARNTRLPLTVAWPIADRVAASLREATGIERIEPAGSIRRRRETIGDIDLLVATTRPEQIEAAVRGLPFVKEVLWSGMSKISFLTTDQFQIDLRMVAPEAWGAALLYFTGSKAHNIALRDRAIRMGYKLNEYGVFRLSDGQRVAGFSEAEVYDLLGLAWVPPEIREETGEIQAAEADRLPRLVTIEDIKGDFHAHTTASDGSAPIEAMIEGAIARGYQYLAITDHSYSLGVTQGLTEEKAEAQWRLIDQLNRRYQPFRALKSVELEIRASGELDFPDEFLARFDLVTASIHTGLRQERARITRRMLGAIANPHVHILNHPSGRLLAKRPPAEFDFDTVVNAASAHGTAFEINGSWDRLDLKDVAARQAKERGCKLSLGSDAHSVEGLENMRFAVAIARRAWCEPADILNAMDLEALLAYIAGREAARRR